MPSNLYQEKMTPSCTVDLYSKPVEKQGCPDPHLLQLTSMHCVLAFVDARLRVQINVNIFQVLMPVKKKIIISACFQLVILFTLLIRLASFFSSIYVTLCMKE